MMTRPPQLAVQAIGIGKTFPPASGTGAGTPVLENLNLDARTGELIAIFGRSGSGKTTLLNLLGGLDRPTSGTLQILGVDTARAEAADLARLRRTEIGFVFQRFLLQGRRTALANVMVPLLLGGMEPEAAAKRGSYALEAVGLASMADRPCAKLSGGQCQRVALARAIAPGPRLLLADEPTGNLDATTAGEILELLQKLKGQHGLSVIVTTHDDLVLEVADRSLNLRQGRLEPSPVSAPASR